MDEELDYNKLRYCSNGRLLRLKRKKPIRVILNPKRFQEC